MKITTLCMYLFIFLKVFSEDCKKLHFYRVLKCNKNDIKKK
jgi:hypothetical protein